MTFFSTILKSVDLIALTFSSVDEINLKNNQNMNETGMKA